MSSYPLGLNIMLISYHIMVVSNMAANMATMTLNLGKNYEKVNDHRCYSTTNAL